MDTIKPIRFVNKEQNDFVRTLNKRVNAYFKDNHISKSGGLNIKIKSIFMLLAYVIPYMLMMFKVITNPWMLLGMCVMMGLGMAGIGLSVMHDANHGTFSSRKWLNSVAGFSLNFLGGNVNNWKAQHNIMHHSFTNIDGYDDDIDPSGVLRFSPNAEKKKIFRYQHLYAWFFYSLMSLTWTFMKDFKDVVRYQKNGLYKQLKTTFAKELTLIIVTRIMYFFYIIVLPLMIMDVSWWQVTIGFLTIHFVAGLSLALIFQLAHIMEETKFPVPVDNSVDNQWAVHQLQTTLNFANNKPVFTWLIGGLNHQVEHHLFPHISHVHYPKIAPIVKMTALEYNLPYNSQDSFFKALASHTKMLYTLGRS